MTRLSRSTLLPVAGLALLLASPTLAKPTAPAPPPDPLAKTLDGLLTKLYPADAPGAAVIAVRDGRTVLRKAYGMADLELGVPLQPDIVFRIDGAGRAKALVLHQGGRDITAKRLG